ncbi:MAG: hypothetical protein E6I91_09970 [Chloroflexi bacterium]|nr:MAG: hypothetical protein E6I91_09970 [Chloroflexota bacterium]
MAIDIEWVPGFGAAFRWQLHELVDDLANRLRGRPPVHVVVGAAPQCPIHCAHDAVNRPGTWAQSCTRRLIGNFV